MTIWLKVEDLAIRDSLDLEKNLGGSTLAAQKLPLPTEARCSSWSTGRCKSLPRTVLAVVGGGGANIRRVRVLASVDHCILLELMNWIKHQRTSTKALFDFPYTF